jgi:hypothetical protein
MNQTIAVTPQTQSLSNRIVTVVVTFSLALIMLTGVGFVQGSNSAVHDALPVALLCISPVKAFYSKPMLIEKNWREGITLDTILFNNQWPERV